jgi:hypothetical protein
MDNFTEFVDFSVEEKKYQIGVYTGLARERPYYRPLEPEKLAAGIVDARTTKRQARFGRILYDMIKARQRANCLYERVREDYYLLAMRNAESDIYWLENFHNNAEELAAQGESG